MSTLYIRRGDTQTFDIAATEPDGDPFDLTDVELQFTVKRGFDDSDADAVFSKTIGSGITLDADPATGLATLVVDGDDTSDLMAPASLVWDLQADDGEVVTTLAVGTLRVEPDVTRGL